MPDEVQILLSNCEGLLYGLLKPIVTVAVHTGMRKGEILSLERDRVNFEQGMITVLETKNGERRDIPMDETVKSTLRSIEQNGNLVFPHRSGRKIDHVKVHLAFHEALKLSGITDFRFHDLRHTFCLEPHHERRG